MKIEARPWGFGDWDRRKISKKGEEREVLLGAGERPKRHWGLGPAYASVAPPGPLGAGCSPLRALSAGKGPHRPRIFGVFLPQPWACCWGGVGISCCPDPSSPRPSHPIWQLRAPAVPRPCVSLALLGPSQLLCSQAGSIWWPSPTGGLSIWCHRWCGIVCGQCHENARHQVPPKIDSPSL